MIIIGLGCSEESHHRISDVFIQRSSFTDEDICHSGEIRRHEVEEVPWIKLLGNSRESCDIREKDGEIFLLSTEFYGISSFCYLIDDMRVNIVGEVIFELTFLSIDDEELVYKCDRKSCDCPRQEEWNNINQSSLQIIRISCKIEDTEWENEGKKEGENPRKQKVENGHDTGKADECSEIIHLLSPIKHLILKQSI